MSFGGSGIPMNCVALGPAARVDWRKPPADEGQDMKNRDTIPAASRTRRAENGGAAGGHHGRRHWRVTNCFRRSWWLAPSDAGAASWGWRSRRHGGATGAAPRLRDGVGVDARKRGKGLMTRLLPPVRLLGPSGRRACHPGAREAGGDRLRRLSVSGGMMGRIAPVGWRCTSRTRSPACRTGSWREWRIGSRTAFPDVLSGAAKWVGNPVRKEIVALPSPERSLKVACVRALRVLVVGGSPAPARSTRWCRQRSRPCPKPRGRWWCTSPVARMRPRSKPTMHAGAGGDHARIHRGHGARLCRCRLVICRAGAMTVAEVACAGVAASSCHFPSRSTITGPPTHVFADREAALMVRQNEPMRAVSRRCWAGSRKPPVAMASKAAPGPMPTLLAARACMNMAGAAIGIASTSISSASAARACRHRRGAAQPGYRIMVPTAENAAATRAPGLAGCTGR